MRLLFIFMQNPWQCLVWWVDVGFNGGTVYRRRPLQQGYIRGYGTQQDVVSNLTAYATYLSHLYTKNENILIHNYREIKIVKF